MRTRTNMNDVNADWGIEEVMDYFGEYFNSVEEAKIMMKKVKGRGGFSNR